MNFSELKITESNFPDAADAISSGRSSRRSSTSVPLDERVIALDRVLASVDTSQIIPKNVEGVKADPPPIFFSKTPAVLVNIDGDPIWSPIAENDLKFAVNTNWDLFEHEPTKTFYLRNDKVWLKAADVKGPWTPAGKLPDELREAAGRRELEGGEGGAARPDDQRQPGAEGVRQHDAGGADSAATASRATSPVQRARALLWVSNTESDVFRLGQDGRRSTSSSPAAGSRRPDFTGPWTFATPNLPADFKKIPLEHPRSRVLASVPGTPQAAEAVLLAQIPQTARVNKKRCKAPEVAYQGEPEFQPIETDHGAARRQHRQGHHQGRRPVLHVLPGRVVHGRRAPTGPWEVTGEVPKQIYEIPVSSPSHTVTYVTVEERTTTQWSSRRRRPTPA